MTLHQRIISVLEGPATEGINFRYDGVRVYGNGYRTMARAVRNGRIRPALLSGQREAVLLRQLGGALYRPASNSLVVSGPDFLRPATIHDEALVVHEMTHALTDYHKNPMTTLLSEIVAYTAQMMYVIRREIELDDFLRPVRDANLSAVFRCAWDVARSVTHTEGGYEIAQRTARDLGQAIPQISVYANADRMTVDYDGL